MPEVTLKINSRGYGLSCENGQEQRLVDLSHYVDSRLQDIAKSGAATNESHLLVLTSLVLADEIYEMQEDIAKMQEQIHQLKCGYDANAPNPVTSEDEKMIVQAIDYLSSKIENIAERIQDPKAA